MKPASRDVVCDTPVLQYLHQLGLLELLPRLAGRILVPSAVADELREGFQRRFNVPDLEKLPWITPIPPAGSAHLNFPPELGAGEQAVLAVASGRQDLVAILDDSLARHTASARGIRFTGTLGLLVDAKRAGLVPAVAPLIEQLQKLGFRASPKTKSAMLKLAGEE
jgi:predicted nucleic acid-binding protein